MGSIPEPQRVAQSLLSQSAELSDGLGRGVPGEDRDETEGEQPDHRVLTPVTTPRVGQLGQPIDQREGHARLSKRGSRCIPTYTNLPKINSCVACPPRVMRLTIPLRPIGYPRNGL